jgi:shikimate dehydrogenase
MLDIDTSTQVCAVIGNPVRHSLSPAIHNAAFAASSLNYVYVAFEVVDLDGFAAGLRAMPSFRGVSVTIPHKVAILPLLDAVDPLAQSVGCVNTITNDAGHLRGSITDGTGTLRAFSGANVPLEGRKVLFLGTGGAVRAVAFAMAMQADVGTITLLGRTPRNVATLAHDLRAGCRMQVDTGDLEKDIQIALSRHDVIVQGTPIGMHPHGVGQTCVPASLLRPEQVVFDMVYRPMKTQLVLDAEAVGCKVILGLEMLLYQATLQFETWTGVQAPVEIMRDALIRKLAEAA